MSVVKGCIHSQDPQSSIPLEILLEKRGPLQRPSFRVLSVTQGSSPRQAFQHPSSLRQVVLKGLEEACV